MNIKEGIRRIYIVAAVLWASLICYVGFSGGSIEGILYSLLIGLILPVVVYYVALWIYKGFIKK